MGKGGILLRNWSKYAVRKLGYAFIWMSRSRDERNSACRRVCLHGMACLIQRHGQGQCKSYRKIVCSHVLTSYADCMCSSLICWLSLYSFSFSSSPSRRRFNASSRNFFWLFVLFHYIFKCFVYMLSLDCYYCVANTHRKYCIDSGSGNSSDWWWTWPPFDLQSNGEQTTTRPNRSSFLQRISVAQ